MSFKSMTSRRGAWIDVRLYTGRNINGVCTYTEDVKGQILKVEPKRVLVFIDRSHYSHRVWFERRRGIALALLDHRGEDRDINDGRGRFAELLRPEHVGVAP